MLIKAQEIVLKEYTLKFSKDTLLEMIKNQLAVDIAKEMIKSGQIQIEENAYRKQEITYPFEPEFIRWETEIIFISKNQFTKITELIKEILSSRNGYEAEQKAKAIINILSN